MLESVLANPLFQILALLLGVLGVIVGIRGWKFRKPRYAIRSYNLIRDSLSSMEDLEVEFKGKPVETLTISRVGIWNQGRETIKANDIPEGYPISISVSEEAGILDAGIVQRTDEANDFHIREMGPESVIIGFQYLDKGDGGVVQIAHTGPGHGALKVDGKVMGANEIKKERAAEIHRGIANSPVMDLFGFGILTRSATARVVFGWVVALASLAFVGYIAFSSELGGIASIMGIIIGLLYLWAGLSISRRGFPRGLDALESPPEGLS